MRLSRLAAALAVCIALPQAAAAEPDMLGQNTETHCAGSEKVREDYYGLFNNVWIRRNTAEVDRWVDPEFGAGLPAPGGAHGPSIIVGFVTFIRTSFPRRHLFNDIVLCADDVVVARQTVLAKNDGPMYGKPASGLTSTVTWIDSYRFRNGRVFQTFGADGDTIATQRQSGWVLVAPGGKAAVEGPVPWVDYYPPDTAR
jgi:hypothetical protein